MKDKSVHLIPPSAKALMKQIIIRKNEKSQRMQGSARNTKNNIPAMKPR